MKDEQEFARESEDFPDRRNCRRAKREERALGNTGDDVAIMHKGYVTVTGDPASRQVRTWM